MARELRPLVRRLGLRATPATGGTAWEGTSRRAAGLAPVTLLAATVGVGPSAAGAGTARTLDRVAPSEVLVVGIAGAIDPRLGVGDLLAPARVVDAATGARFTPRAAPGGRGEAIRRSARGGVPGGTLVTVATLGGPLPDPLPPDAVALDMETAAIAAECEARGIHWDVVRAVSDLPGVMMPEAGTLVGDDGQVRIAALARLLARRPSSVLGLARLGLGARRAGTRVTRAVVAGLGTVEGRGAEGGAPGPGGPASGGREEGE